MSVTISVVIPAWNRADHIGACLESVLAQTHAVDEVIVVDDASVDATVAVVEGIRDPRIRCVKLERNGGAQAARNAGISAARCDWIAFQDSDDLWLPEKIERQVEVIKQHGGSSDLVVHGDALMAGVGPELVRISTDGYEGDCLDRLLRRAGPMFQCLLTSRSALERIGLLDQECPSYQEWDTAIRLATICQFARTEVPLMIWRRHEGNAISNDRLRELHGYDYVVDKHRSLILARLGRKALNFHKLTNAMRAMECGMRQEASRILVSAQSASLGYRLARLAIRAGLPIRRMEKGLRVLGRM